METAAAEGNVGMLARYDAQNPPAFRRLLAEGIKLRRFSDDILQAAEALSFELMEAEASTDATYHKVYTAFKKWRADSYRWFGTAEQTYAAAAFQRREA